MPRRAAAAPVGALRRLENAALAAVFALTLALPLAEMALRATLAVGIQGVVALVQHADAGARHARGGGRLRATGAC